MKLDQESQKPFIEDKEPKVFLYQDGNWRDITRWMNMDSLLTYIPEYEESVIEGLNKAVCIDYEDSRKRVTQRKIVVHVIKSKRKGEELFPYQIQARCLLRKQNRTFQMNHIHNAYDPDTGEVITDLIEYLLSDSKV